LTVFSIDKAWSSPAALESPSRTCTFNDPHSASGRLVDKAEQIGLNWWKFDPNLSLQVPAGERRRAPQHAASLGGPAQVRAPNPLLHSGGGFSDGS
jgi:hypothetical protein